MVKILRNGKAAVMDEVTVEIIKDCGNCCLLCLRKI